MDGDDANNFMRDDDDANNFMRNGDDTNNFIRDVGNVKDGTMSLIAFENKQEDLLNAAENDLFQAQNQSGTPQTVIKFYKDQVTRRLLLQNVTGLFVNKTDTERIKIKTSSKGPNRYKQVFLNDGMDIVFLERGSIIFLYERTPGDNGNTAASFGDDDIKSFYILLLPQVNEKVCDNDGVEKRLFKIIEKRLPDVSKKFSWMLVQSFNDIKSICEEHDGEVIIKHDNIIGKGRYFMENNEHNEQYRTTIKYDLEVPEEIELIQNQFHITKESSFYIMMLNPVVTNSTSDRLIELSELTQNYFKPSYRWSQGHPDMMTNGCEMLLINGSIDNVQQILDQLDIESIADVDEKEEPLTDPQ